MHLVLLKMTYKYAYFINDFSLKNVLVFWHPFLRNT